MANANLLEFDAVLKLPTASCGVSALELVLSERCRQRGIKPVKE